MAETNTEPTVIELDPDVWMRGIGSDASYLLTTDDKGMRRQCCIGVACTVFGMSDTFLRGEGCIEELPLECVPPPFLRIGVIDEEVDRMRDDGLWDVYRINDDPAIDDAERVALINVELAKLKASFRFALKAR
jgi:hypothetical protein